MDGLELDMGQSRADDGGKAVVAGVDELLQRPHAVLDLDMRRRHVLRIAGAGAADPVLGAAELAGALLAAAAAVEQHPVHLADQTIADGQALFPLEPEAVLKGGDVVDHLALVVLLPTLLVELEQQHIRERRLSALDLGRDQCLSPDVEGEEQVRVG